MEISEFIDKLSSKAPVPGGGGASALVGAVGVSLCSMVANLTLGKQKYAGYREDIENILCRAEEHSDRLLDLIGRDAEVFEPLAKAYSLPKDAPDRDGVMENALSAACSVPLEIMKEANAAVLLAEGLLEKGSRLALSDVGVAAAALKAAMEGAVMNVYINTKLMKNRVYADQTNCEAAKLLREGTERCGRVYDEVLRELRGDKL